IASGATVHGPLTVLGSLTIASGSTVVLASGSTVDLSGLVVRNALRVIGDITVEGLATFLGDVEIHGLLSVSSRQAGFVQIPKSGTAVTVTYEQPFTSQPVVTAASDSFIPWRLRAQSATGFTLETLLPADEPITFSWQALGLVHDDGMSSSSSS